MKKLKLIIINTILLCPQLLLSQTMHDAIKADDLKMMKSLLKNDSELLTKKYPIEKPFNIWSAKEISPLYDAILYGRSEMVQYLIEKGVDLTRDNDAIFLAVVQREERIKHLLVEKGARICNDTTPPFIPNILTQAVTFHRETYLLKELIELGAPVNVDWGPDANYSHTPLGMATRGMFPEAVKLFIENGAELNKARNWGRIGLHDAITYAGGVPQSGYSPEVLNLLLEHGGDRNHRDVNGDTPFEYAAIKGVTPALKILWDSSYDISQTNYDGMTLLHRTVILGYLDNVKFLMSKGFDVNIQDNYNNTPLYYAYKYGHKEIAELLKTKGAKTDKIPSTENVENLLNEKLKKGQAYVWYLGRLGWIIKTRKHLIITVYDWKDAVPDNPSLANGSLVSKELYNQNMIFLDSYRNKEIAETLVAKENYLKTTSSEKNITYLYSSAPSAPSESQHINSFFIGDQERKEVDDVIIERDNGNWLFISDGIKIFFNGDRQAESKQFINDSKNPDISFISVTGGLGDLSIEDIQDLQSNIELFNPQVMFFQSIYTNDYLHQEMRKHLKGNGCKVVLPLTKFPGDGYFYDASATIQ